MNSNDLKIKIEIFKKITLIKNNHWVYEPNSFDKFLDNSFNLFEKILLFFENNLKLKKYSLFIIKMIKNSIIKVLDSLFNSNKLILKSQILEKKLDEQQKFIEKNIKENLEIKSDLNKINSSLNKILETSNNSLKQESSSNAGHNSVSRIDFYQEENLRIGSELLEAKKKFEILKSELDKYVQQRSNLISKINSVNEAISDTNVLTNVFNNNVNPKINVIDHNKIKIKSENNQEIDLNEEVRNIFSNKK